MEPFRTPSPELRSAERAELCRAPELRGLRWCPPRGSRISSTRTSCTARGRGSSWRSPPGCPSNARGRSFGCSRRCHCWFGSLFEGLLFMKGLLSISQPRVLGRFLTIQSLGHLIKNGKRMQKVYQTDSLQSFLSIIGPHLCLSHRKNLGRTEAPFVPQPGGCRSYRDHHVG